MAKRVLQPNERVTGTNYGVKRWMKTSEFKRARSFYFDTLDEFARRLSPRAEDGDVSPVALTELLKVVLRNDHSVLGFFEKRHRSTGLMKKDEWDDLLYSAAGYVVESYLATAEIPSSQQPGVVTREELGAEILELLELAVERGEVATTAAREAKEYLYTTPSVPAMLDTTAEELERIMREEALVAVVLEDQGEIPLHERNREIQKRALANLRISELREIAIREGLGPGGSIELIADRIVSKFKQDEEAIARLVLDLDDPGPEARFVTRLLPLRDSPEIAAVHERFVVLSGRYVRVRVAKWFVIREVESMSSGVRVKGAMRYYQVAPREEEEEASLSAIGRAGNVVLRLNTGEPWVEADVQRGADAGALAITLQRAAGVQLKQSVVSSVMPTSELAGVDVKTLFFIDFVNSALMQDGMTVLNMSTAEFATDRGTTEEEDPRRPAVLAVRLQGQHLLSSTQACQLVTRGRSLTGLVMLVRWQRTPEESIVSQIKLSLGDETRALEPVLDRIPTPQLVVSTTNY